MTTVETTREYRVRAGFTLPQAEAPQVGAALQAISDAKGGVTPEDVIEAAQPRSAPLHPYFEWDTKAAAHQYRLHQARYLLRAIEVKIVTRNGETHEHWVKNWHAVRPVEHGEVVTIQPERRFVPMVDVQANDDYMAQVIHKAERDALGFAERYRSYREIAAFRERLGPVLDAIAALSA